ncbi:hypothetical protein J6590_085486 [Homalodisca vitripennis]|nr:hypothetical protein J6590_085486 [Homalodisca vitripennis]
MLKFQTRCVKQNTGSKSFQTHWTGSPPKPPTHVLQRITALSLQTLSTSPSLTLPLFSPYQTISLTPFLPSQTSHPCPSAYHRPLLTNPLNFSLPYCNSLPSLSHYLPNPLPALPNLPPMSFSVSPPSPHKPFQLLPSLNLIPSPPLPHKLSSSKSPSDYSLLALNILSAYLETCIVDH